MSSNALLWPSQGTIPERMLDKYKWLRLPSQGFGGVAPITDFAMAYEPANWADAAYKQRIPLTINGGQVSVTQNDFVLLINSTFPELIGESVGSIRIGTNDIIIDYDIQEFDDSTGELIAWAKVSSISDADVFYVYFDNVNPPDNQNPFEVWSDYESRYSLSQVPAGAGSILDSTIQQNNGTPTGTSTIAAKIGQGLLFTPSTDQVLISNSSINFDYTISVWFKTDAGGLRDIFSLSTGSQFGILVEVTSGEIRFFMSSPVGATPVDITTATSFNDDVFHLLHLTFDSVNNRQRIFVDGVLQSSVGNTQPILEGLFDCVIGQLLPGSSSRPFDGSLDEFRVFRGEYVGPRALTEFNNQNAPDTFYSTGTVEAVPPIIDTMAYQPFTNWFDTAFLQRFPLTINGGQVPSTQNDFPLLINGTFPELIGEAEAELRFAGVDEIQLEYEIQEFDDSTGELIAWVKKPTVDDGDIVYVYFDNNTAVDEQNSAAVWDANYDGVWHCNQTVLAVDSITDSTGNAQHLTPMNNPILESPGKIGKAIRFIAGLSQRARRLAAILPIGNSDYTIEAWISIIIPGSSRGIIGWGDFFETEESTGIKTINSDTIGNFWVGNDLSANVGVGLATGFHHIMASYDSAIPSRKIYFDSVLVASDAPVGLNIPNTDNFAMGVVEFTDFFDGIIDETRISDIARSADYVTTSFNNQNSQSTFYTKGTVEKFSASPIGMEYEEIL